MPPEQKIRVWSIQDAGAWEAAKARGYWTGDSDHVEDDWDREHNAGWRKQYDWMREQMAERISGYSGDYPMWAYLKRPNMRQYPYIQEPSVMITAAIPRGRMVISDYDLWHMPLNNSLCSWTEAEYDAFYEKHDRNYGQEAIAEAMETWVRVFDLRTRTDPKVVEWMRQPDWLQACIDQIHPDEIVSIKPVTGRVGKNRKNRQW